MDLFEEWINKKDESQLIKRALTDQSYKTVYLNKNKEQYPYKINKDLSVLGDAIINFSLSVIMLDKVEIKFSKEKSFYERDEVLVEIIAKHYDLIKYIDKDDCKCLDYNYNDTPKNSKKGNNGNIHKYIATAVEAMLGAIYLEIRDINPIISLIGKWKLMIDDNESQMLKKQGYLAN